MGGGGKTGAPKGSRDANGRRSRCRDRCFILGSVKRGATFFACVALAGCGGGDVPFAIDRATQAIVGGTNDNADQAVVALIAQAPNQRGQSLCTAEVINPRVLLTAAHC